MFKESVPRYKIFSDESDDKPICSVPRAIAFIHHNPLLKNRLRSDIYAYIL